MTTMPEVRNPQPEMLAPEPTVANATGETSNEAAASMLIDAEDEGTLETRAQEIAERYIAGIPESDRRLTDPSEISKLLYLLKDALRTPPVGPLRTYDHLGNLPTSISNALRDQNRTEIIAAMQRIADTDSTTLASETNKLDSIANSSLPDSIKKAIFCIHLEEGEYTTGQALREISDRLDAEPSEAQTDPATAIIDYKTEMLEKLDASDKIRQVAIVKLMEGIYPDLMKHPGVALLFETWNLDPGKAKTKDGILPIMNSYQEVVGNTTFSREYEEFGGAQNIEQLLEKLDNGAIKEKQIGRVLVNIQKELEGFVAKQIILSRESTAGDENTVEKK